MLREWTEQFAWHSHGQGFLDFQGTGVGVDWQLVQTESGSTFLLVRANGTRLGQSDLNMLVAFHRIPSLSGFDADGYAVRVQTRSRSNPVHSGDDDGEWTTFGVKEAERVRKDAAPAAYRFTVLNLVLDDPPVASWNVGDTRLVWRPVDNYQAVVSTLYTRDRLAVTATLTVWREDRMEAVSAADIACELASYACGCRIQWIHLEGLDASEEPVSAWIPNAITGPFVGLPLIEKASIWSFVQDLWEMYSAFRADRLLHARRLLGMVLNATSTDDFLELRGMKLAGTLDALMSMVLTSPLPQFFVSRGSQKRFMSAVRSHILAAAIEHLPPDPEGDSGQRARRALKMAGKANEILRPSFREQIEQVCEALAIKVDESDLDRFVRSRNELVHEARFVCQKPAPPDGWPFEVPAQEYFWMLRFVDRFVLRKIGYRGPFIDRFTRDGATVPEEDRASEEGSSAGRV